MLKYIGKRLLQLIPVLIGITFLSFAMMRLAGGDAVTYMYEKALQQYPVRSEPWSHNIFWRYFLPVYDRFNSWPVHIVIRFSVHLLQPPD